MNRKEYKGYKIKMQQDENNFDENQQCKEEEVDVCTVTVRQVCVLWRHI
jgi:hypothetical protein